MDSRSKSTECKNLICIIFLILVLVLILSGCITRVDFYEKLSTSEIVIKHGYEYISNGTGACNFGSVDLYTSVEMSFFIENTGFSTLNVSNIALASGDVSQFSIDASSMTSNIAPGNSTMFMVIFKSTSAGYKRATLKLQNNSTESETFTFSVEGYGISTITEPDITVKQGVNELPQGSGTYDFANIGVGTSSAPVTFTISNNGDAGLSISDTSFSSGACDQFSIIASSIPCNLKPLESTTFNVTFLPTYSGNICADVCIINDDPDESPYNFRVQGYGEPIPEPEIKILQGASELPNTSGYYNFGSIEEGSASTPITFIIENCGTADLDVTDINTSAPSFILTHPSFPFTIAVGTSKTFTIMFQPPGLGTWSSTITIENNDPKGNPFTFTVEGEGVPHPEPDIQVKHGSLDLLNGTGLTDFGHVLVMDVSSPVTITIENTGTGDLIINNVSFTSGDTVQFSLQNIPSSPVLAGGNSSFEIIFSPTSAGYKSAVVTIDNTDPDENPYEFSVEGYGDSTEVPDIKLPDVDFGGIHDFGNKKVGDSTDKEFKIENKGTGNLTITSVTPISGDASQFNIDIMSMSSIIAPGDDTKFKVFFSPTLTGNISAVIAIDNNDPDENPYTFTVCGYGDPAPIADITVSVASTNYPDGSTCDFGTVMMKETKTFTIENMGTDVLDIVNILLMEGDSDFTLDLATTSFTLSPGESTTFKVVFDPASMGDWWRNLVINSNDPDESPYNIRFEGSY